MTCAFAQRGLSPSEKLVLLALANYANEDMACWPSHETLAVDTELSERTVYAALKELESKGIVARERRRRTDGTRTSDRITLHFAGVIHQTAIPAKSTRKSRSSNSQISQDQVAAVATLTTFEPSVEPSEEPVNVTSRRRRPSFDVFWEAYPRKVGKLAAEKAWKRADLPDLDVLLAALAVYVRTKPADIDFCHPVTWLNQGRWLDEHAPQQGQGPPAERRSAVDEDFLARQRQFLEGQPA